MRLIGMALLHFLWQGVAIAALAFMAMSLARRASAKYLVAVSMLGLMTIAPVLTFLELSHRHESLGAVAGVAQTSSVTMPGIIKDASATVLFPDSAGPNSQKNSSTYLLWLVEAWFAGVVLLSLRPAAGFLLIERLQLRKALPLAGALRSRCMQLQQRLGLRRVIRYCESLQLEAPAVAGWFRPVMLLPVTALTGLSAEQLDAVIAHELAHVKRLDAFVNLFQIATETLLFYHPAVWWLSKHVRAERENCCDDVAISVCGNAVAYARALAAMAEWQAAPSLAMAANRSPLAARVARLLGVATLKGGLRGAGTAGSVLCLCAAALAGNALLGAAHPSQSPDASSTTSQAAPIAQPAPAPDRDALIVVRPTKPAPTAAPSPAPTAPASVAPLPEDAQAADQGSDQQAPKAKEESHSNSGNEQQAPKAASYIDGLKSEGLTDLSVDQLIAMKVQGVTPEYVHRIHALGLKPDVDELIAMRVQGVSPELIRELRDSGVTSEIDQIIAMKVQGVTPEYIKQLHDLGLESQANNVIAMKVQGVEPDYIRAMRAAAQANLSAAQLIAMKVQGLSPEYVKNVKNLGFEVDAGKLIGMKVQGVTPEYVKGLQAAGLKVDAEEAIAAKVQGITPEFVERARKHGFQNLTLEKLLMLKNSGVLDE
jgi:beta-lactamase regulating signal transducer with metallopeptidase domain